MVRCEDSWLLALLSPIFAWDPFWAAEEVDMVPLQPLSSRSHSLTIKCGFRLVGVGRIRGLLERARSCSTWLSWPWTLNTWGTHCRFSHSFEDLLGRIITESMRGLWGLSERVPLSRRYRSWAAAGRSFNLVQGSMSLWRPWQRLVSLQAWHMVIRSPLARFLRMTRLLRSFSPTGALTLRVLSWRERVIGDVRTSLVIWCGWSTWSRGWTALTSVPLATWFLMWRRRRRKRSMNFARYGTHNGSFSFALWICCRLISVWPPECSTTTRVPQQTGR